MNAETVKLTAERRLSTRNLREKEKRKDSKRRSQSFDKRSGNHFLKNAFHSFKGWKNFSIELLSSTNQRLSKMSLETGTILFPRRKELATLVFFNEKYQYLDCTLFILLVDLNDQDSSFIGKGSFSPGRFVRVAALCKNGAIIECETDIRFTKLEEEWNVVWNSDEIVIE